MVELINVDFFREAEIILYEHAAHRQRNDSFLLCSKLRYVLRKL